MTYTSDGKAHLRRRQDGFGSKSRQQEIAKMYIQYPCGMTKGSELAGKQAPRKQS